jgi:hypothetical protein
MLARGCKIVDKPLDLNNPAVMQRATLRFVLWAPRQAA